ncbi:hypothetical protein HELRODRAFT_174507 [Helobdella robusta]|uniref:Uncharacterized protein n=1 Tax=Helobdella robusta TaxID=6412 RepID=T1F873_HELRO|nr:hypothetical protein HELRODRAFT_174507 [Helobdella robusta]ESO01545.1 hypothetical protein HELRODRAFT_174507 [Helobdella robusta]
MLKPQTGTLQASTNLQQKQPSQSVANLSCKPIAADNFKLIQSDLDSSLASLAGNLNMSPVGQIKKTEHQWTGSTGGEKKLTGGTGASAWGQQSFNVANNWAQSGVKSFSTLEMYIHACGYK